MLPCCVQVIQQYMMKPYLIDGRKFHLRLWVLITGVQPLRAFLHRGGLALFSSEQYRDSDVLQADGTICPCQITNYARNASSMVLTLRQLESRIGNVAFTRLWRELQRLTAVSVTAALGPMHEAHAWLKPSTHNYGFQMIGVDYLLDSNLKPWLLEFNSSPSIMARHADPRIQQDIFEQKWAMLCDMVTLLQHRLHGPPEGGTGCQQPSTAAAQQERSSGCGSDWCQAYAFEMENCQGFVPLMPHFAYSSTNIPWSQEDRQLAEILMTRDETSNQ